MLNNKINWYTVMRALNKKNIVIVPKKTEKIIKATFQKRIFGWNRIFIRIKTTFDLVENIIERVKKDKSESKVLSLSVVKKKKTI